MASCQVDALWERGKKCVAFAVQNANEPGM